ncbi:hypothetical protein IHE45_12G031000 [Dioscorea alata]|uniref:Uncharacterized protein n=1 Tax=Dioscorea alata TaxID=55571 RepID=A0ACB7V1A1_DIOAL|nr:hypothetical protein IHE45_12G031000 [Dioscorea alata]
MHILANKMGLVFLYPACGSHMRSGRSDKGGIVTSINLIRLVKYTLTKAYLLGLLILGTSQVLQKKLEYN